MPFQTMNQAVDWIINHEMETNRTGIQRIKYAMKLLNHPESHLPVIHLTGTNGKGSTTAFLRQLLKSQGYKVGSFTSPHIHKINERIQYDGNHIPDDSLLAYTNQIFQINEQLKNDGFGSLGFFEIMTIMAALYFKDVQPDVCLIEVGIGGLNDNTNIFAGQIAVITTIGLDHVEKLGHRLEDIAYQKAGIIKENAQVITGNITDKETLSVIEQVASKNKATLYRYHQAFHAFDSVITPNNQTQFVFKNQHLQFEATLNLLGRYQVDNASVAIEACLLWMQRTHRALDMTALQDALKETKWPARLEKIHTKPQVYIDGAHNVLGLEALKQAMRDYFQKYRIRLLYSGLSKKDQQAHLNLLTTFPVNEVILTEFEFEGEVLSVERAQQMLQEYGLTSSIVFTESNDWEEYVHQFISNGDKDDLLIITGSLYFVSQVRQYIQNL
ncbi:bifunctional folylpolyglutamate synthase/dihydrofolate synthase [Aerococcaceae bacterium DSM 111020]|nr:bifunctional folylpolyglutamate synthase/dihydrofolate synthase [Aerococcaceae bacterium DSM 111020]